MSIHVNFYREQSTVTLIQRMQHSKNRLCGDDGCNAAAASLLECTAGVVPKSAPLPDYAFVIDMVWLT